MKTLFTLLLYCCTLSAFAQARIGYTEAEIKAEFWQLTFTKGYTEDDNTPYISTTDEDGDHIVHYFDNTTFKSVATILVPANSGSKHGLIERYNKTYVIKSPTEWHYYTDNGSILRIQLLYNEESEVSYFLYTSLD